MPPLVTLTTDFGLQDSYVGVVKGVILSIAPDCQIVDITHAVPPQQVVTASYHLQVAYRFFPRHAVHVAVVDPGVGTDRRAIAVRSDYGTFIGPDNGVLSGALTDHDALSGSGELHVEGRQLTNESLHLQRVSTSFHGRDIFAPVAARLASGLDFELLGEPVLRMEVLPINPPFQRGGHLHGEVVHIDHYGNAITNIGCGSVSSSSTIEVAGNVLSGIEANYQAAPVVALSGSSGFLEIAARNGSAARQLGIVMGDPIVVKLSG